VSNLTAPDGKLREDHGIKAGSVTAIVAEYAESPPEHYRGGPQLHQHLFTHSANPLPGVAQEHPTRYSQILGYQMIYLTSKTTRKGKGTPPKPVLILHRSAA
jgi:hypothetical protein